MSAREPVISFPEELPVSAARGEIAEAIRDNQVVIVAGATGSGKTTQLPKICLELGRTRIAHTQPRRIAARSIAERIAEELEVELGTTVGYKVRFTDRVTADTRVAVMTDGILLNEINRDRLLRRYDTVIIDEAHERSLNVDFLLGYLRRILPERPDLKVIVTSATIDPVSFARHFADATDQPAPIIEVSGRTFPVEIRYRAPEDEVDDLDGICSALRELDAEAPGDVLVFLPGEAEIRDAMDAVRGMYAADARPTEVLPLYGRLSWTEQHRVFQRSGVAGVRRRVIVSTNVAETSLTVPGIRYVVDAGTARISRYSARSKIQRLPIEAISQASAQQRSGRAGRTSPGIAIRLYAEDDFVKRPEFTEPEILRTSLASVLLQMLTLGFGDMTTFPFLTPPDSRGVKAALDLLIELGAVRSRRGDTTLTGLGRQIARLPIDPRLARMLQAARRTGALRDVLAIVAGLSIQDVRERPEEHREQADRMHARFTDPTSDFLAMLNLWNHLQEQRETLGSSAFRRLCRAEHLNYVRVREWVDVHRQLSALMGAQKETGASADPDDIHRAILAGLLSQIGVRDDRSGGSPTNTAGASASRQARQARQYLGARNARFSIFPGSGLRARPEVVMAAELVETSRLFARTVAAIDPAWAEPLAGDLAKRRLSDPHWSKGVGAAVASETVTLFGVEIVSRRRVQLSRIDPPLARELFVRHALVEEDWDPSHLDKALTAFLRRNRELRRRLERIEERERRRDILSGDEAVFGFYDTRIPADVVDVRSLESWWRDAMTRTPRLLDMTEADLIDGAARSDEHDFPARWRQGDQVLSVAYRFEPGADDDGVTVVVPVALLAQLHPDGFDWQVPGMRDELIAGLIRALPKAIRRHVVPAADWAGRLSVDLGGIGPESSNGMPDSTLRDALAARIQPVANQPVVAADFDLDRVPAHLRVSFRVIDDRGRTLASGRDLAALQRSLADRSRASVARSQRPVIQEAAGITDWVFDTLPEVVDTRVAGGIVRGYPALVDEGPSVSLRIEATPDDAASRTRTGVRRLVLAQVASPTAYVLEHLTASEKLALAASPYPSARALIEDCRAAVADAVIRRIEPTGIVRDRAGFERVRDAFSVAVVDELFACVSQVSGILTRARDVERRVRELTSIPLLVPLGDVTAQRAGLVYPSFASATGVARLTNLPRYLRAALVRLDALADDPGRDRVRMTEFERAAASYADAGGVIPVTAAAMPTIVRTRWLLEEYRVSLWAQSLGTAEPVSLQRIQRALRE